MLTFAALLLHGYHLGVQDQAIYLPAVKKLLNPALYPLDSVLFVSQTRWTWFDEIMAGSVRLTRIPLEWLLPLWHMLCVFGALLGCWRIAAKCFATVYERWGAVLLVAAVLALPASGTEAPLLDNYVHPRNFSTVAALLALPAALDRRWSALAWLAAGIAFHPLMGLIGAVHIAIIIFPWRTAANPAALLALPVFSLLSADGVWQDVLQTRRNFFPLRWTWYEWLGVIVPLAFLCWSARRAAMRGQPDAARVCSRMVISTSLFVIAAVAITVLPAGERLIPTQPMRGIHLTFLLFVFFAGGWIGGLCRERLWRWGLFLLPVCAAMVYWQAINYPATPHIDWPGAAPRSEWLQAFDWVKHNTPRDAYFALDPMHMTQPGNDSHGFRALAERSMLADYVKDRAVAGLSSELAPRWRDEWRAAESWKSFHLTEFRELRSSRNVSWVIVAKPQANGLDCPWWGPTLAVCRIPMPISDSRPPAPK